jgi:hypothetical protein
MRYLQRLLQPRVCSVWNPGDHGVPAGAGLPDPGRPVSARRRLLWRRSAHRDARLGWGKRGVPEGVARRGARGLPESCQPRLQPAGQRLPLQGGRGIRLHVVLGACELLRSNGRVIRCVSAGCTRGAALQCADRMSGVWGHVHVAGGLLRQRALCARRVWSAAVLRAAHRRSVRGGRWPLHDRR